MKTALSSGARAPLLERESEISAIRGSLSTARTGRGRVLSIIGPPGTGKTRLIDEVRARARRSRMTLLFARGGELERGLSFGVVRQLFDPVLRAMSARERRGLLAGAAALAAPVLGLAAEPVPAGPPDAIWHALYWLTANLTENGPLAIAVDDAHWSDTASLQWLLFLARRADDLPLTVTIAHRENEPSADGEVLAMIAREPIAQSLRPAALSPAAVAGLVRGELGDDAADEFCAVCHASSGGNPFLVERLIGALAADGVRPTAEAAEKVRDYGPSAVSTSIFLRLGRLPPAAVALAEAVAVLERGAELRLAAALAGAGVEEAAEAADALAGAHVLAPERPLTFVHPVVRTAVYADLSPAQRAQMHDRAARLLDAEGAPLEQVAEHILRSEPRADPWSVERLRAAAGREGARGAPGTAVSFLGRALREPPADDDRAQLLLELGTAELQVGDPAAPEHLAPALEALADPAARAGAAVMLSHALTVVGRIPESAAVVQRAIAELDGADPELDLMLKAELLACSRMAYETRPIALDLLEHIDIPEEAATPAERALLAQVAAELCAIERPAKETAAVALRALEGGHLVQLDGPEAFSASFALSVVDRLDEARAAATEAIDHAARRGSAWAYGFHVYVRADASYRMGNLASAEADARQGLEALGPDPQPLARSLLVNVLVDVLVERAELDEADAVLERYGLVDSPVLSHSDNGVCHARGRLRLRQGAIAEAREELLACGEREEAWKVRSPAMVPWRSSLAETLVMSGEPDEARRLAAEELELARAVGAERAIGIALRASALASAGDEQIALLQEAVEVLERSPARLEHARALTDLGAALRRADRRADAREALERGLDAAHACGATALVERARTELLAAGSRPRRLALEGRDSLTPSEQRVAEMAAQGLTNRELAQALFVTVKTVEMHLAHVYRKLDIGSRAELPAALHKQG